jgi:hypothetical protein
MNRWAILGRPSGTSETIDFDPAPSAAANDFFGRTTSHLAPRLCIRGGRNFEGVSSILKTNGITSELFNGGDTRLFETVMDVPLC